MLLTLACGLLLAAVGLAGRWSLRRTDALGRSRAFPLVSVILLAGLGLGLLVPVVRQHRLEARLDRVASTLVGAPATVHCQTAGQELVDVGAELGYVKYDADGVPEHATLIKRGACKHLAAYARGDHDEPSRDEVVAVHVLSHEARHMAGTTDEAAAECQAVQRDAWTAQLLGASAEEGLALARRYWREVYPNMPSDYVAASCRPGGSMDEHLPAPPW